MLLRRTLVSGLGFASLVAPAIARPVPAEKHVAYCPASHCCLAASSSDTEELGCRGPRHVAECSLQNLFTIGICWSARKI